MGRAFEVLYQVLRTSVMSSLDFEFRCIQLSWFIEFAQQVFQNHELGIRLMEATEDFLAGSGTEEILINKGETIAVEKYGEDEEYLEGKLRSEMSELRTLKVPRSFLQLKDTSKWLTSEVNDFVIRQMCSKNSGPLSQQIPRGRKSIQPYQGTYIIHCHHCPFMLLVEAVEDFFQR